MDSETQAFDDEIINEDSGLFIDKKDEEEDEEEDRGYPIAQILWKGNSYYLYQGDNLIGRIGKKKVEVALNHNSVSDIHAEISFENERITVRDLQSLNCTFAEKDPGSYKFEKVTRNRFEISDGSSLRFGFVQCVLKLLPPPDHSQPISHSMPTPVTVDRNRNSHRNRISLYEDGTQQLPGNQNRYRSTTTSSNSQDELDSHTVLMQHHDYPEATNASAGSCSTNTMTTHTHESKSTTGTKPRNHVMIAEAPVESTHFMPIESTDEYDNVGDGINPHENLKTPTLLSAVKLNGHSSVKNMRSISTAKMHSSGEHRVKFLSDSSAPSVLAFTTLSSSHSSGKSSISSRKNHNHKKLSSNTAYNGNEDLRNNNDDNDDDDDDDDSTDDGAEEETDPTAQRFTALESHAFTQIVNTPPKSSQGSDPSRPRSQVGKDSGKTTVNDQDNGIYNMDDDNDEEDDDASADLLNTSNSHDILSSPFPKAQSQIIASKMEVDVDLSSVNGGDNKEEEEEEMRGHSHLSNLQSDLVAEDDDTEELIFEPKSVMNHEIANINIPEAEVDDENEEVALLASTQRQSTEIQPVAVAVKSTAVEDVTPRPDDDPMDTGNWDKMQPPMLEGTQVASENDEVEMSVVLHADVSAVVAVPPPLIDEIATVDEKAETDKDTNAIIELPQISAHDKSNASMTGSVSIPSAPITNEAISGASQTKVSQKRGRKSSSKSKEVDDVKEIKEIKEVSDYLGGQVNTAASSSADHASVTTSVATTANSQSASSSTSDNNKSNPKRRRKESTTTESSSTVAKSDSNLKTAKESHTEPTVKTKKRKADAPVASTTSSATGKVYSKAHDKAPALKVHPAANIAPVPTPSDSRPRLIFTGIQPEESMSEKIGAVIVARPQEATHMIIGDEFKRTAKVMIAINSGIKYIVQLNWLEDSAAAGRPIPITSYTSKYIARDTKREKLWSFSLNNTLNMSRGNVFQGWSFYITSGVCGVSAPPAEEMKEIVTSGSGIWLDTLPSAITSSHPIRSPRESSTTTSSSSSAQKDSTKKLSNIKLFNPLTPSSSSPYHNGLLTDEQNKVIIISSDEALKTFDVKSLGAMASSMNVYSPEFIFLAVLQQRLNFKQGVLKLPVPVNTSSSSSSSSSSSPRGVTGKRK